MSEVAPHKRRPHRRFSFWKYPILLLVLCLTASACFRPRIIGAISPPPPQPENISLTVTERFATVGAAWNSWVRSSSTTIACDGTESESTPPPCIHAGSLRQVLIPSLNSCSGVTLSDNLGAFDWICSTVAGGGIRFVSSFKRGKGLADLISISGSTGSWRSMSVSISGHLITGQSAASAWWSDPISLVDASSSTASLSTSGTVYVMDPTKSTARGVRITAHRVSFTTPVGTPMSLTGALNCDLAGGSSGSNDAVCGIFGANPSRVYLEGSFKDGQVGARLIGFSISRIRNFSYEGGGSSASISGIQVRAGHSLLFEDTRISQLRSTTSSVIGVSVNSGLCPSNLVFKGLVVTNLYGFGATYGLLASCPISVLEDVLISGIQGMPGNTGSDGSPPDPGGDGNAAYGMFLGGNGTRLNRVSIFNIRGGTGGAGGAPDIGPMAGAAGGAGGSAFGIRNSGGASGLILNQVTISNVGGGTGGAGGPGTGAAGGPGGNGGSSWALSLEFNSGNSGLVNLALRKDSNSTGGVGGAGTSTGATGSGAAATPLRISGSSNFDFEGLYLTNVTGSWCSVSGGGTYGITGACGPTDSSGGTFLNSVDWSAEFQPLSVSDDAVNATESTAASVSGWPGGNAVDFFSFSHFYRHFGPTAMGWPLSTIGAWFNGTGQLYDWRPATGASHYNRSANGVSTNNLFSAGSACPSAVHGNQTSTLNYPAAAKTILAAASEISAQMKADGSGWEAGNQNGVCEAGETCLYTPHIGAFQGLGSLQECIFEPGTVTGVRMLGYPELR